MPRRFPLFAALVLAVFSSLASAADAPPAKSAPRDYSDRILTPKAPATPRVNGPSIYGQRPGRPFLYTIPATGDRPMKFAADNLPDGLKVDEKSGRITGKVEKEGKYEVTLRATNDKGSAEKKFRIVIGDDIALTPPLGWNSWNSWAKDVDQEKVLASAKAMVDKGLINHGWTYVNIDDAWQGKRGGEFNGIQPNEKFPDMKGLANQIHDMGLKIGIYSTPWVSSYAEFNGGSSDDESGKWDESIKGKEYRRDGKKLFAESDAKQWAAWGIDYLKYDWNPRSKPVVSDDVFEKQVADMAKALHDSGRDIAYSYSNSMPFDAIPRVSKYLNAWRTTGDIRDSWWSLSNIGFQQDKWAEYAKPGHWNDPDMLVVGHVGWSKNLHPSNLTADEQYLHISLWSLLSAPLLIGCPIERMDEFTLSLLTNDEVIAVNQDALGKQARLVSQQGGAATYENVRPGRETQTKKYPRGQVWVKELEDGSRAVGLINAGTEEMMIVADFKELKLDGKQTVRDLWRQKELTTADGKFEAKVAPHGVVFVKLSPAR
ncbi:MAG: alpha-galactosidase [Humisphaera sp.]|nr:alpha-galactosidase [Humisphaera sp.]